jgi:hypothetical protein
VPSPGESVDSALNNASTLWSAAPRLGLDIIGASSADYRPIKAEDDAAACQVRAFLALRRLQRKLCCAEAPGADERLKAAAGGQGTAMRVCMMVM